MGEPDLVAQSCSAGVQSTTLLLLSINGVLPKPDVVIFADTGWEPEAVYRQVEQLEAESARHGIEFLRVSQGNLRRDAVDPMHRFASIPYFILGPDGFTDVMVQCPRCDGAGSVADIECQNCGGRGQVPTGDKRPLTRSEREGMGRRQCTSEYKLAPIKRKVRELLGAAPPDYRRVPKGRLCEQWIGFSTDEVERANPKRDNQGVQYLSTRYPLLELGMSRDDCDKYLAEKGWGATVKSACIGCPYHGNRMWRDLRDNHPDEWADAVEFDSQIRKGGARGEPLRGEAFLHRSRVPLDLAPIDRLTQREFTDSLPNLLDLIEEGEPEGCSPYGCRSGEAIA